LFACLLDVLVYRSDVDNGDINRASVTIPLGFRGALAMAERRHRRSLVMGDVFMCFGWVVVPTVK
jgi:hypothetical protein